MFPAKSKHRSIEQATQLWYREFEKNNKKCLKKIRITDKPPKNTMVFEIYSAMEDIKTLKQMFTDVAKMNY